MIINCECGKKKFNVDSDLIPEKGRLLKCGSCSKIWHFIPPAKEKIEIIQEDNSNEAAIKEEENNPLDQNNNISENVIIKQEIKEIPKKEKFDKSKSIEIDNKENKIKKSKDKNNSKIFSNTIVIILTFIAIIILIDTFKNSLSIILPGVIPMLDSLYETLTDLHLFIKDLTN